MPVHGGHDISIALSGSSDTSENSLKNGAPGYEEINTKILQLSVTPIIGPQSFLCNRSLTEGAFLLGNQFGFRKVHCSYMAFMFVMDQVTKALDNGECVIVIFLDFSKAFDTVNHSTLIEKLYHYGIRGNAVEWFRSDLSDISQYVSYNGVRSNSKSITCGVPQGSILGPLLYLININDLYNICRDYVPMLFADDTNLFYKGNKMEYLVKIINGELENISLWLRINKLSLNIKRRILLYFKEENRRYPFRT